MNGHEAYEADVRGCPLYPNGMARPGWFMLGDVERDSWERNPTPRNTFPTVGTVYLLPGDMTWEHVAAMRKHWDISPDMVPQAVAPGVVAWARPLPNNYTLWRTA